MQYGMRDTLVIIMPVFTSCSNPTATISRESDNDNGE